MNYKEVARHQQDFDITEDYAPTEWLRQNSENHGVSSALCPLCFYGKIKIGNGICSSQLSGEHDIISRSRRNTWHTS